LVPKNYSWIWIAVDRLGKQFVGFVNGNRSTETRLKLWENIFEDPYLTTP
jgi:IS1 family transposase